MLASGQIGFDIKNQFIKDNKNSRLQKDDQFSPKSPPPQDNYAEELFPEETFKPVGKNLKLNQSAMNPDKKEVANQKLEDLADKSDTILLKVSTVFPFTFFVNDIIIDPYKVNIIFREFFFSEHIHSIMVKDILDVVVETSLLFATVKIVDQGYVENTVDIAYLKKDDALRVRKIIQGLVIAHRQAVDLSVLPSYHIKEKASDLGKVKGIDDSIEKAAAPNLI